MIMAHSCAITKESRHRKPYDQMLNKYVNYNDRYIDLIRRLDTYRWKKTNERKD